MSSSLKVFLAVALGSFVGALVALQANASFWWIGLPVGGLIGYLSYKPMTVARAVPIAAREAADLCGWTARALYSVKHVFGWALLMFVLLVFWCTLVTFSIVFVAVDAVNQKLLFGSLVIGCFGASMAMCFWEMFTAPKDAQSSADLRKACRVLNPITFFGIKLPHAIWKVVWSVSIVIVEVIIGSPRVAVVLFRALVLFPIRFVISLTRLIHTDERLLCGVDAAIGAGIGYFTANALLGALIGGIFGVLNFEILSKRVFKLVPQRR